MSASREPAAFRGRRRGRARLVSVAVIAVAVIAICLGLYAGGDRDKVGEAAVRDAAMKTPVEIGASVLWTEFATDAAGAAARYRNRPIIVAGRVFSSVRLDATTHYVLLETAAHGKYLQLPLQDLTQAAQDAIKDGSRVSIRCEALDVSGGEPSFDRCALAN